MDNRKRFFERRRENWRNLQRLGVNSATCTACGENDPICFIGDVLEARTEKGTLYGLCERCKRKRKAPSSQGALQKQRKALHALGCKTLRCYCGEDNPFTLEADHIDGQKTSGEVLAICINCHLKRTRRQLTEYPQDQLNPADPLVRIRNRFRGFGEHLERMAEWAFDSAQEVHELALKAAKRE